MRRITLASTLISIGAICFIAFCLLGRNLSGEETALKIFVCGIIIAIGGIYFTNEFLKVEKIIFDIESLPLLETDEAVDGVPFAGEGIVEPEGENILKSLYTNVPCVYFHSIKEQYVRRGKYASWEVVENVARFVPFYLRDKRGKLKIDLTNLDDDFSKYSIPKENVPDPKNSEVDCDVILKHHPYPFSQGAETSILNLFFTPKYRVSEFVLRPGTKVFVCGMVSRRDGELVLHEDEKCPLIISKKNRDQYVREFYRGENLIYLRHFLVAIGFTMSLLAINYFVQLNQISLLNLLFFGNTLILGSAVFTIYNRIVTLKNRALNALSNIDIELERRADLIPSIVEIVKGYAKHESEIQKIVAEGRAQRIFSSELKRPEKPTIPSLVAAIENYPELKASENFQSLMRTLVDTEERIAYSREFYNRTVRKYNTLIKQIPFSLVAKILKLKEMEFVSIVRG
jgi:LemA protein